MSASDAEADAEEASLSRALSAIEDPPLRRSDDAVRFHALVFASSASLDALLRIARTLHADLLRQAGR